MEYVVKTRCRPHTKRTIAFLVAMISTPAVLALNTIQPRDSFLSSSSQPSTNENTSAPLILPLNGPLSPTDPNLDDDLPQLNISSLSTDLDQNNKNNNNNSSSSSSNNNNIPQCFDPSDVPPPYVDSADCDPVLSYLLMYIRRSSSGPARLFVKRRQPPIPLGAFTVYRYWSAGSCFVILDSDREEDEDAFRLVEVVDAANQIVTSCVRRPQKAPLGGRMSLGRGGFFVAVANTESAVKELEQSVEARGVPYSVGFG